MNKKLLLTTALVGFVFAGNAYAERPTYYAPDLTQSTEDTYPGGGMSNINSILNSGTIVEGGKTTISNASLTFTDVLGKPNAHDGGKEITEDTTNLDGSKIDLTKTGTFTMSGGDLTLQNVDVVADKTVSMSGGKLNMSDTTIKSESYDITGGVSHLNGGNKVEADSMSFKNAELNFSGATNELRSQNITIDNVNANVLDEGALSIAGGGQTINFLNTNNINTKDGGVAFRNATANIDGVLTITDTSGAENAQGKVVLNDSDDNTKINLGGTLNADVSGKGNVNFTNSASKIDGNVDDVNVYFQDNHILSEAITGDIDVSQMMISNDGSLLADKEFVANDLVIGSKDGRTGTGSMSLMADASVGGAKVNKGSMLNLGDNKLTVDGGHVQGNDYVRLMDGSTLAFNFGKGQIVGDANLEGMVNLKPTIALGTENGSHEFVTGDITFDDKTINDSTFDPSKTDWTGYDNNNLYNINVSDDKKSLEIEKRSQNEMAAKLGANGNQASATNAVISGGEAEGNSGFNNVANNISNLLQSSNSSEVAQGLKMVDQMSADTTSSAQTTTSQTTTQVFSAVGTRLSGGSVAGASQGKSSGDSMTEGGAVWAQGMYNKAELDGANGFDADTNGIAFGAEKQITDSTKLGIGYAYSQTDIDSNSRKTDIDTHTAIAYGEYKPSNWFVNGIATYGWGSYDESNAVKKASYDVDSIGLQAMTGYDIKTNVATFTPETGLRYVNINQKAYTDSLGNKIAGGKSDILTGVAGIKVSKDFETQNGMILKPEMRIAATYDLSNDDANSVVTLANGSSYSTNGEALDKFGMEFGAGLTADINDNVEMSVGYEGRFRTDYSDHTGLVNAKYKF